MRAPGRETMPDSLPGPMDTEEELTHLVCLIEQWVADAPRKFGCSAEASKSELGEVWKFAAALRARWQEEE